MTHLEKIRSMSAEELAKWLLEEVEQQQFSADACGAGYCPRARALMEAEEKDGRIEYVPCTDEGCLAAAVAYLNSEVEK